MKSMISLLHKTIGKGSYTLWVQWIDYLKSLTYIDYSPPAVTWSGSLQIVYTAILGGKLQANNYGGK